MDDVLKRVREVRRFVYAVFFYYAVLDFVVAFLATAIIFDFAGVGVTYALAVAAIYSLARAIKNIRRSDVIADIEAHYRGLRERLTTAYDNRDTDNVLVRRLRTDVLAKMDAVESTPFIDSIAAMKRVFAVIVLCFVFIGIGTAEFKTFPVVEFIGENPVLNEAREAINNLPGGDGFGVDEEDRSWEPSNWSNPDEQDTLGAEAGGRKPGVSYGPIPGTGGGAGEDVNEQIFGQASSASLEGQDIDFKLHPEYGGDIEISQEGDETRRPADFALPDVASLEECAECVVGPEHEEIVRRYFEKIAEEQ